MTYRVPEEGSIPSWAAQLVADTSYVRARVDTLTNDIGGVRSEVDKLQASQVPLSDYAELKSDVRQMRDSFVVWRAISSFAAAVAVATAGYAVAHLAGWVHG